MLLAALGEHFSWITSRAAGVAALVASSAAVAAGLLMSGPARRRVPDLRAIHEALSLATLGALLLHALSLLGDEFLSPSLADIAVPFVSGYQRGWTSLGIVAGWMLLLLGLSYYARGRIGPARWRRLHRWTALAWVFGVVHGIAEGTDAGALWFVLAVLVAVVPVAALPAGRLAAPRPDATTAPA
jgi:methionine sulfoxide reductase heme-binding subunit